MKNNELMRLVVSKFNYDFYIGINKKGEPFYNIVPTGSHKPNGGYGSSNTLQKLKGFPTYLKHIKPNNTKHHETY